MARRKRECWITRPELRREAKLFYREGVRGQSSAESKRRQKLPLRIDLKI